MRPKEVFQVLRFRRIDRVRGPADPAVSTREVAVILVKQPNDSRPIDLRVYSASIHYFVSSGECKCDSCRKVPTNAMGAQRRPFFLPLLFGCFALSGQAQVDFDLEVDVVMDVVLRGLCRSR